MSEEPDSDPEAAQRLAFVLVGGAGLLEVTYNSVVVGFLLFAVAAFALPEVREELFDTAEVPDAVAVAGAVVYSVLALGSVVYLAAWLVFEVLA